MEITIKDKLYKDIIEYCKLNNIIDSNSFINNLIKEQFMVLKYGIKPFANEQKEEVVINEISEETQQVYDRNVNVFNGITENHERVSSIFEKGVDENERQPVKLEVNKNTNTEEIKEVKPKKRKINAKN